MPASGSSCRPGCPIAIQLGPLSQWATHRLEGHPCRQPSFSLTSSFRKETALCMGERSGAPEFYYFGELRAPHCSFEISRLSRVNSERPMLLTDPHRRIILGWQMTTTNYWVGKCVPGHRRCLTCDPAFDSTYYVAVKI